MPLLSCRECRESVSTQAPFCPHCGVPQPAATEEIASPWTGLLYIGSNGGVAAIRPDDGEEVWRTPLGGFFSGPGKNDVCVLEHEGRVFAGSNGLLFCLDARTGKLLWKNELRGLGHNDVTLAIGGQSIQYVSTHTHTHHRTNS